MPPGNLLSLFSRKLVMVNALRQTSAVADSFPAWIGGTGANLEVDDSDSVLIEFQETANSLMLIKLANVFVSLNGRSFKESILQADIDYALMAGSHLILFSYCRNPERWIARRTVDSWRILAHQKDVLAGPLALRMLRKSAPEALEIDPKAILHHCSCTTGFYLHEAMEALGWSSQNGDRFAPEAVAKAPQFSKRGPDKAGGPKVEEPPDINTDCGEHTCPACWLRFDRGDVLHVATHASLMGDPLLGAEEMMRFPATRFNNLGQALDGMGLPATDLACPHCRRRLPPSFLDLKQHIVSIVGAAASGKSYFLSVLVKVLQNSLFTHFGTAFYDGDPRENVLLTQMKNKLFSASTPAQAMLAKTDLQGDMYIPVKRQGREVRMPKPFVFNLAPQDERERAVSLVFYDNAGEHFEPDADSVSTPGAQHVAAASGLIFLFDPTYNLEFRKRLSGQGDPQLDDQRFDQQDTLLAEMSARIKKLRGVNFRDRIETPLAMVVGKSDVWAERLGSAGFMNPMASGVLDMGVLDANSRLVRAMLLEIVPAIVANAEAISSEVRYFPVSAFGCSPEYLGTDTRTGRKMFSPDPNKIAPKLVEIPMLWLISHMEPDLVKVGGRG